MKKNYFSELLSSSVKLWNSKDNLSFKNIRRSHLQYFFAFPLGMIFANTQEVLFTSDFSLWGLNPVTLSSGGLCLGAGVLFLFTSLKNISLISKISTAIAILGFVPWLILPDSTSSLVCVVVFMAGMGGCAMSGAFSYAFALNNAERFWGSVLIAVFYSLSRLNAGYALVSPSVTKFFLAAVIALTALCLAMYRTNDFIFLSKERNKDFGRELGLVIFIFASATFMTMFYSYIPGTDSPNAIFVSGISGIAAVIVTSLLQLLLRRNVWLQCSVFFLSMVGAYALLYVPEASSLRQASYVLRGFEMIGYMISFYLMGCLGNKYGDFRILKKIIVIIMLAAVLVYLVPDLLSSNPSLLHTVAMASSSVLLIAFLLLAPAFSKHLFAAEWSDDFRKLTMSEAKAHVEQSDRFANLGLTPREKEITVLLLQGMATKQVASELNISVDTAKFHIKNLYKKLGIGGRAELFARFGGGSAAAEEKVEISL